MLILIYFSSPRNKPSTETDGTNDKDYNKISRTIIFGARHIGTKKWL